MDNFTLDRVLAENNFDMEAAASAIAADLDAIAAAGTTSHPSSPSQPSHNSIAPEPEDSWALAFGRFFSGFVPKPEEVMDTNVRPQTATPASGPPIATRPGPTAVPAESVTPMLFSQLLGSPMAAGRDACIHMPEPWTPCEDVQITSISSEEWATQWAAVATPSPLDINKGTSPLPTGESDITLRHAAVPSTSSVTAPHENAQHARTSPASSGSPRSVSDADVDEDEQADDDDNDDEDDMHLLDRSIEEESLLGTLGDVVTHQQRKASAGGVATPRSLIGSRHTGHHTLHTSPTPVGAA